MSDILIRDVPDDVHARLEALAAEAGASLERFARDALAAAAARAPAPRLGAGGIDFEKLAQVRRELGIEDIGDSWMEHFDDPAFSREVLGLNDDASAQN